MRTLRIYCPNTVLCIIPNISHSSVSGAIMLCVIPPSLFILWLKQKLPLKDLYFIDFFALNLQKGTPPLHAYTHPHTHTHPYTHTHSHLLKPRTWNLHLSFVQAWGGAFWQEPVNGELALLITPWSYWTFPFMISPTYAF